MTDILKAQRPSPLDLTPWTCAPGCKPVVCEAPKFLHKETTFEGKNGLITQIKSKAVHVASKDDCGLSAVLPYCAGFLCP